MERQVFFFAVAIAVACTGDDPTSSVQRDSAGISIIEHAALPDVAPVNAVLDLSIGVQEGAQEYQFFRVTGAARLTDGRIVVGEGESGRLRWFDSSGRLLQEAGGRGSGPGEFRYIAALVPMPGDSVAVWGGLRSPVAIFDPNGRFVRQEPLDQAAVMGLLGPDHMTEGLKPLPDGSFVLSVYERREGRPPMGEVYRPPLHFHRVSRTLERVDTLGEYGGFPQMRVDIGERVMPAVLDFPVHARLAAGGAPLRIYAGNGEHFEIRAFDAQGRLDRIIRVNAQPRAIQSEEIEASRRLTREFAERQNRLAEFERMLSALPTPTHFPAYDALEADSDGGVWVRRWAAPSDTVATWHVFGQDGTWQRAVQLPAAFTVHHVGDGWILGVERDALEVEYVRIYSYR